MRVLQRVLGFLWTVAAAMPLAARPASDADSGSAGVSAPSRGPRSDTRASVGQVRIGLGESVLRDLRTPFVAATRFQFDLTTCITRSDSQSVRPSDGQTVPRSNQARAPPAHS